MSAFHDLVIHTLADSEAALIERVRDLAAERDTYRELAQVAMHAIHDLTRERDRLRRQHHHLLGEYRAHRVRTMPQAEAA